MIYPLPVFEEWEPCAPVFVETDDGFVLTDAARQVLELLDAPDEPTVPDRVAALRQELGVLAAQLPVAARAMDQADLVDTLEAVQEASNLLGACDAAVVAELDRRGVHERWGHTSTASMLVDRLRVRPGEAKRRVEVARACVERVGLDAQVLPPLRRQVAAAQAAGIISVDHAAAIDRGLRWLPAGLPVPQVDAVETALVDLARARHPSDVALAARAARDVFDPDGPEPRDAQQRRRRGLTLTQRDDGTGRITGELTADLLAKLQTVLSPLAAPRPDDAHGPDTRTPTQRLHDAVEDVCDRLLRSGTLPDSGGVPATVCVTITVDQLEHRTGRVHTSHGGDLSVPQLLHLAAEADVIPVVLGDAGGILSYGRSKRFATAAQTKALRARDGGCSFPGCTRPPEWCQRHHVEAWVRNHGDTDVGHMTLLCARHHHAFESWGWTVHMVDGVPWWTPPPELDPDQKPLRNHAHGPPPTAKGWPAVAR